jgi:SPP1 family predicted phage head-tail adaptor
MRKTTGVKAGPLMYLVTIQRPEVDTDVSGEAVVTAWTDVATVWAAIEALSGREWLTSAEFRPNVTTRIRVRWRDGLDASMRVLHRERVYGIDAVLPQYQGMSEIHLMCTDGVITQGGQP